jgi:hypothetical protein
MLYFDLKIYRTLEGCSCITASDKLVYLICSESPGAGARDLTYSAQEISLYCMFLKARSIIEVRKVEFIVH